MNIDRKNALTGTLHGQYCRIAVLFIIDTNNESILLLIVCS